MKEKFGKYGKISNINVIRDPFTEESRGFGFITYETRKEAEAALEMTNKTDFEGRTINVEISKRSRPHNPTPGAYLGPTTTTSHRRRRSPNERKRYQSRSKSRSDYRNRRTSHYSRSASRSFNRK